MTIDHKARRRGRIHETAPRGVTESFRDVLARFCSGVAVVTAADAGGLPVGMTVGSFTSISLAPPLVGFYAGTTSTTLPHVLAHGAFCVNILAEQQTSLAQAFARSGTDKFNEVEWSPAPNGSARLTGAHAWIDCQIYHHQTIGDHDLVVGQVDALVTPESTSPLIFHRSAFHGLGSGR